MTPAPHSTASDLVDQLATALKGAGDLIAGIGDDQWELDTPCSEWSVTDLVSHVVAGNLLFNAALRGTTAPPPPAVTGSMAAATHRRSAERLVDAFGQTGALEEPVAIPFGTVPGAVAAHLRTVEALVHGWDLAQATGQRTAFPDSLAERELAFSLAALADMPPDRRPFAAPQPVDDGAPAIVRLVACLGRPISRDGGTG